MDLILCIEDNENDAEIIRRLIAKSPLGEVDYHTVSTIRDALHFCSTKRPTLVIMDLNLKDKRGIEAFEAFHSVFEAVPVIAISGVYTSGMATRLKAAGAYDYIDKFELNPARNRLFETIEEALNKHKKKMDWQAPRETEGEG